MADPVSIGIGALLGAGALFGGKAIAGGGGGSSPTPPAAPAPIIPATPPAAPAQAKGPKTGPSMQQSFLSGAAASQLPGGGGTGGQTQKTLLGQ